MQKILKKQKLIVITFFIIYFFLGVLIFRDYGTTWDDYHARVIGQTVLDYVTGKSTDMLTFYNKDYGPVFELLLVIVERVVGINSPQQIIYLRHFVTFLLFFISSIFLYKIAFKRFKSRLIALLSVVFLILSPRIFADSFYNTKDMAPFAAMIIATYTMIYFLERPSIKRGVVHALACAFLVDVRLPGLIVIGLTVGFFLIDKFLVEKRREWVKNLKILFSYLGIFILLMIVFWPYLWIDPIGHFMTAFANMSNFVRWDDTVLYFGKFVKAVSELPWHYPLVWIGITTPLIYLGMFVAGTGVIGFRFVKNPIVFYKNYRKDLIFLSWFFIPLISVIVLHSVLYDGWRHLYFIYPALILIGLVGAQAVSDWINKSKQKLFALGIIFAIVTVNLTSVIFFMIMYHPYQNLYFNVLAGGMKNAKKNFELDYYGLSFRKGMEYIARTDTDTQIPIFFSFGFESNIDVLPDNERKRFVPLAQPNGAKYILSNYRWHPQDYSADYDKVYEITIDGTAIMSIFKFY